MPADDAAMDAAYLVYCRARSKDAKALALVSLLKVSEGFISRMVRRFSRGPIREIEREEALQQARLGFIDAVGRADPKKGPLRPYCMSRIRHELQTLAEVSFSIKIPRRSGMPAKMLQAVGSLYAREGREPTPEELNGHGVEYEATSVRPRVVTSFDAPRSPEDLGSGLSELLAHDTPSALDILIQEEDEQRKRASPMALEVVQTALSKPVPRKSHENLQEKDPMPPQVPEKTNPITQLATAIDGVKSYLKTLDEEEAAIRAKRSEVTATLASMNPTAHANGSVATMAAPKVILALNQDKLPNRVVTYLKANPGSRVSVIAEAVGDTSENVGLALTKLRTGGIVTSEGKARGTSYSLAEVK